MEACFYTDSRHGRSCGWSRAGCMPSGPTAFARNSCILKKQWRISKIKTHSFNFPWTRLTMGFSWMLFIQDSCLSFLISRSVVLYEVETRRVGSRGLCFCICTFNRSDNSKTWVRVLEELYLDWGGFYKLFQELDSGFIELLIAKSSFLFSFK